MLSSSRRNLDFRGSHYVPPLLLSDMNSRRYDQVRFINTEDALLKFLI